MTTNAILRRSGWRSTGDLEEAAERSTKVGKEDMPDEVIPIADAVIVRDDPQ